MWSKIRVDLPSYNASRQGRKYIPIKYITRAQLYWHSFIHILFITFPSSALSPSSPRASRKPSISTTFMCKSVCIHRKICDPQKGEGCRVGSWEQEICEQNNAITNSSLFVPHSFKGITIRCAELHSPVLHRCFSLCFLQIGIINNIYTQSLILGLESTIWREIVMNIECLNLWGRQVQLQNLYVIALRSLRLHKPRLRR